MKTTSGIMKNGLLFALCFICFFVSCSVIRVSAHDEATECGDDFQKLTGCLDYGTGKSTTPTKECCGAVKSIMDTDPKCLCYIFQQAHSGNDALKNLGVKEDKLIQLPSACQLQNANITNCPKLLGLSPSSPDAAIFLNTTSSATTPALTGASASPDKADGTSVAVNGSFFIGSTAIITIAIFFYAFPTGVASFLRF